jgi:hypothetical protein
MYISSVGAYTIVGLAAPFTRFGEWMQAPIQ